MGGLRGRAIPRNRVSACDFNTGYKLFGIQESLER